MIKNRFQLAEQTSDGNKAILRGMVFKFYDGALKAVGRLVRTHPLNSYIIIDKQENTEYLISKI